MNNFNRVVRSDDPTAPAWSAKLADKSDTVRQVDDSSNPIISRSLLVGQDTTAKVTMADGTVRSAVLLQKGYNPIAVKQVWSTGTDSVAVWFLY